MTKFTAVIFDLDGTIADTLPLCIAAFKQSVEPLLGKEISEEEIYSNLRAFRRRHHPETDSRA